MVLEVSAAAALKKANIPATVSTVKPTIYKIAIYTLSHTSLIVLIRYYLLKIRAVLMLFITITVFITLVLIKAYRTYRYDKVNKKKRS